MTRVRGLDLARGVACVAMIQAHAYDAYVDAPHRGSTAFAVTRFLALLPLPLFMVLAGMGVALRVERGRARGEATATTRRELTRRGGLVLLSGYALNLLYGLMDGARTIGELLRFDVLHVIGASILLLGALLPGRARPTLTASALVALWLVPSPWLQRAGQRAPDGVRLLLVPFVDISPYTKMPLLPLAAWCALGAACAQVTLRAPRVVAAMALPLAVAAHLGTEAWAALPGVTLARTHPIVWLNAVDLAARALVVIGLVLAATARHAGPSRAQAPWLALGTGSLRVYALHLPFAYGALGRPLRAIPDMSVLDATPWVASLTVLTYALLRGTDTLRDRFLAWRYTRDAP
ncbi:MAG: DUF1624 domain-containing protein [Sandaracinaceae bacterium]|nr:DUF1624 domain-containing protein [Sandaracinaceae bacterium]